MLDIILKLDKNNFGNQHTAFFLKKQVLHLIKYNYR